MTLRLTTKKMLAWTAALTAVSAGALGYALYSFDAQNRSVIALASDLEKFERADKQLSSTRSTLNQAEPDLGKMEGYYIAADGVADFVSRIEALARENRLSIEVEGLEAKEVDKQTKGFQEKLMLRIETNGSWLDTYRFLRLVELLPYKAVLESVSVARSDERQASSTAAVWKGHFLLGVVKLK